MFFRMNLQIRIWAIRIALLFFLLADLVSSEDTNITILRYQIAVPTNLAAELIEAGCSSQGTDKNELNFYLYKPKNANTNIQLSETVNIPHFSKNLMIEIGVYGSPATTSSIIRLETEQFTINFNQNAAIQSECIMSSQQVSYFFRGSLTYNDPSSSINIYILNNKNNLVIYKYFLNVNTCHPSCKQCNGPYANQCTSCDQTQNFANGSVGTCSCSNSSNVFHQGQCLSSCPTNYQIDGSICILRFDCVSWDSVNKKCSTCASGARKWEGKCMRYSFSPAGYYYKDTINEYLLVISQYFAVYSFHLKSVFMVDGFSQFDVNKYNFQMSSHIELNEKPSFLSQCAGYMVFGGYLINKKGTLITFPSLQVNTKYIQINFKYFLIDFGSNINNLGIYLQDGSTQHQLVVNSDSTKYLYDYLICGFKQKDLIDVFSIILQVNASPNNVITKTYTILNNSDVCDGPTREHGYFGIQDITIVGFDCSDTNCYSCPNNVCEKCNSSFFIHPTTGVCTQCQDTNCDICTGPNLGDCTTCKSSTQYKKIDDQLCTNCQISGYYISGSQCLKCPNNCKTCSGNNPSDCSVCMNNYYFDADNKCVACTGDYVFISGTYCKKCDSSCKTCNEVANTACLSCNTDLYFKNGLCSTCLPSEGRFIDGVNCTLCDTSCQQCNGAGPNKCTACEKGKYVDPSTNACTQCPDNCADCSNGNSCKECSANYQVSETTNLCVVCSSLTNYFTSGIYCKKCHSACGECNGPDDTNCSKCADQYFKIGSSTRCEKCPNEAYTASSQQRCKNCNYQCIPCGEVTSVYKNLQINQVKNNNQSYCLVCSCTQCDINYYIYNKQQCTDSCSTSGQNYTVDSQTQKCRCMEGYQYMVFNTSTNNYDCFQQIPFGYSCGSDNICFKCNENCLNCSNSSICTACNNGYHLWYGICYSECPSSLNTTLDSDIQKCVCQENYYISKLDSPINGQQYSCIQPLQLISIQLYNSLMQSKYITLPSNFSNNLIVFKFNRNLTKKEQQSFTFKIDIGTLVLNQDYKIISTNIKGDTIESEVELTQNRRVKQITLETPSSTSQVSLPDTICVSKSYGSANTEKQTMTSGLESMNSTFAPNEDSTIKSILDKLKSFQFLCILCNFVQLLSLIYLLRGNLPQKIKFGTLFGASLVFSKTPPASDATFSQSGSSYQGDYLKDTLQDLGLTENLYKSFTVIHVLVIISSFTIIFCVVSRIILKGQQHSILVVNKIANFVCSYLQSSITAIIFSIIYAYKTNDNVSLPIFQIIVTFIYFIELIYLIFTKPDDYLKQNIPNLYIDIDHNVKGAKSYLIISFIKKYTIVFLHIGLYSNQFKCSLISSIIFGISGLYLLYFRFFKSKIFLGIKVFQEFAISLLFAMIAHTSQEMQKVNDSDIITDEALRNIEKLGNIILIIILICISISTLIFLIRQVLLIYDIIQAIKKYRQSKQEKQVEMEQFINNFESTVTSRIIKIDIQKALSKESENSADEIRS